MIICHSVQGAKSSIAYRVWIDDTNGMFDTEDTGDHAADTARRLRYTRAALGVEDQREFGEAAGLEQSLYNRFETGKRLLTLQAAMKLCARYSLTLDWLYRGDPSSLPYKLATDIRLVQKKAQALTIPRNQKIDTPS